MNAGIFFNDLRAYNLAYFRKDSLAALTVVVILVPQCMAYAMMAGLPAIYGLYAAFVPLFLYPIFGTSRQLSVGPVALVSIMVLMDISKYAEPGTENFIHYALLTALVAGIIQLLLAIFRMGFLMNFISQPVIAGFTTAAALIIAFNQVKHLFGLDFIRSNNIIQLIRNLLINLSEIHVTSIILGASSLVFIILLRSVRRNIPAALIAIILGTLLVYQFQWHLDGVHIIGAVESGFPKFNAGFFQIQMIADIFPLAVAICMVSFIESISIAKTLAAKNGVDQIQANKELWGLGVAKVVGAFFQAYPSTGSFSRSAINAEAGAKTGLSSIFTALMVGLILLLLTSLLYFIPIPVLAAIVIAAVIKLIDLKYIMDLWRIDRNDFLVFLTTAGLTLLLGVQLGVFSGMLLSILIILHQSSKPHYAVLGKIPGTNSFRNIERYQDSETTDHSLIIRYDDDIYFGNADHFLRSILLELGQRKEVDTVILDASSINRIDSTGLAMVYDLLSKLEEKNVKLVLTNLRGPIRDLLAKSGITDKIGTENNYLSIADALDARHSKDPHLDISRKHAGEWRWKDK
ncbi:MAG: sulfate permease [Saprospiraceae bacterium]|nr:sulfate permease [Saprospiraceae bacterium]